MSFGPQKLPKSFYFSKVNFWSIPKRSGLNPRSFQFWGTLGRDSAPSWPPKTGGWIRQCASQSFYLNWSACFFFTDCLRRIHRWKTCLKTSDKLNWRTSGPHRSWGSTPPGTKTRGILVQAPNLTRLNRSNLRAAFSAFRSRPEWMVGCPAAHGCLAGSLPVQLYIYLTSSGSSWKLVGVRPYLTSMRNR